MAEVLRLSYTPISSLHPHRVCWLLKAKVTQKWPLSTSSRDHRKGQVFTVTLMDEEGITISASFFDDAALHYFPLIAVNQVYEFEGGEIKDEKPQYRKQGSCYHLSFNAKAQVRQLPSASFRPKSLGLVAIAQLSSLVSATEKYVDIVAVIRTIHLQSDHQTYKKRFLDLVDATGFSVQLTLWGELAKDIIYDLPHSKAPIIYCNCVKLSNYANITLSAEPDITDIHINPIDSSHISEIAMWRDQNYPSCRTFFPLTTINPSIPTPTKYISLKAVESLTEPCSFLLRCRVRIIKVDESNSLWYYACPTSQCFTELTELNDKFHCQTCQITYENPLYRYRAHLLLADSFGEIWSVAYDEAGKQLFETSAYTLKGWSETQVEKYYDTLANLQHRELCCRLQLRIKDGRRKYVLTSVQPPLPDSETKLLLSELLSG